MSKPRTRVDTLGRAYAGSQLQMQIYVNRWPDRTDRVALKDDLAVSDPSFPYQPRCPP